MDSIVDRETQIKHMDSTEEDSIEDRVEEVKVKSNIMPDSIKVPKGDNNMLALGLIGGALYILLSGRK